ncbi:MAG: sugar ABC transporter permease [Clostridia bacterium]|nr:sugar ABC transporter permease [Clostridia bacterium]
MVLKVTQQDRDRVKRTAIIFASVFAVCLALMVLFLCLMPRAVEFTSLGANEERISGIVSGHDDDFYYVKGENLFSKYDSYTHEQVYEFNVTESIKAKLTEKGDVAVDGSFKTWQIHTVKGESHDWLLATDENGNVFKLFEENGELKVSDDYILIKGDEKGSFVSKTCKGIDSIGDDMYMLTVEKGFFYVTRYDLENLKAGEVKKKFIWDISASTDAQYYQIEALKGNTGIISFIAHGDYVFIMKDGGGIIRLDAQLVDAYVNDEEFDFFKAAEEETKMTEEEILLYDQIYAQTYRAHLESELLTRRENKINAGQTFTVTEEQIKNGSIEDLEQYLADNLSSTTTESIKRVGKENAQKAASDATGKLSDWHKDFNLEDRKMKIKRQYVDDNKQYYNSIFPGENTIYGLIYSKKNQAFYYSNASDGYLYEVKHADLAGAKVGSFLSEYSSKIESVKCAEGQSFSNFGNGIAYNEFSNSVFIKYANARTLTIIDLNDMSNYKVAYTFEGDFDMYTVIGNKDNTITHVMRKVVTVGLDGADVPGFIVSSYENEPYKHKALTEIMFVVFLALSVVSGIIALYFALALRSDASVEKVKFIAKDTKKNKFVYLALSVFIIMLIMFCYYEAIGAIAMSFFDYTREKPSWIWNNFANYIKIFNRKEFLPSIGNMLFFLVADLIVSIVPPIIFAMLLILIRNKVTSDWIRSLMFIPGIIPSIAAMLIWRVGIYGDDGILNQIVQAGGGQPINWLLHEDFARWSLLFMGFPFVGGYLIFYGGMMNVPQEYHEAGKLEGIGIIRRFLTIDIPLIVPQIKYIFITTFIGSVQNFARTHILRSTVVTTPVQSMYEMMTVEADYGMSSAYATLIFIFLFAAVAANFKMQKADAMGDDL